MFDWLKDRLVKKENYSDIKGHILNDPKPAWMDRRDDSETFQRLGQNHYGESYRTMPEAEPSSDMPGFERTGLDRARRDLMPALDDTLDNDPPQMQSFPISRKRAAMERTSENERADKIERIEDLLLFMKEQLSAIKAQNDMMNERLKSLERSLVPERY